MAACDVLPNQARERIVREGLKATIEKFFQRKKPPTSEYKEKVSNWFQDATQMVARTPREALTAKGAIFALKANEGKIPALVIEALPENTRYVVGAFRAQVFRWKQLEGKKL